ncbi:precorrin-6A reductase [Mesorhizobium sp. L-8-10]|uniref:cobalt-precorrin-6A reductase n=1 Tax=Mesorhizobium sp. L-8-10 TaxID=2744523 RepID=UPI001927855E|nr:cobalt-precorrin-6A reductase [Mesorhizobium sp. L-8-10]BCH35441.1 precorrin-6A reductase [Mesorhizobium sp. L-8-10]
MTHRILILGGTTEARQLAGKLAPRRDLDVTLSLAGRTQDPVAQPVPVRTGGFGGAEGLAAYLRDQEITLLVDATHPYAARISANAALAARQSGVPALRLHRPAWEPSPGDRWQMVDGAEDAVRALGAAARRIFLALGRQEIAPFETAPAHFFLIRSVDPVAPPLAVPDAAYILGRGPFGEAEELDLLERWRIDTIVCKNSGGTATYAKLAAARRLGIDVLMFRRPDTPDMPSAGSVEEALAMIDHRLTSTNRGE